MALSSTVYRSDARPVGAAHSSALVLLWLQGLYYLATGLWPLISIETFQLVTGPKTDHLSTGRESDHWLVMTVGVLVSAIAVALLSAAWRQTPAESAVLSILSALGLAGIDVVYVTRGVIAPIYLVDAATEAIFLLFWVLVFLRGRTIR